MLWGIFDQFTDATAYFIVAMIGTLLFTLRVVMMMVGGGHDAHPGDVATAGDVDHPGDAHHADSDAGFKVFSFQSLLAFMMGTGWMGLLARITWHWQPAAALGAAVGFGVLMALLAASVMYYMRKLNQIPNFDLGSCVGTTARVYLTIPAKGQGNGQVEVDVQGRRKIVDAASKGDGIPAFATVKIVAVEDQRRLVVEPA